MLAPDQLTVVIVAYNAAATIRDALESLERQTVTGFPVLVVDSSDDATTQLVRQAFPQVRLHHVPLLLLTVAACSTSSISVSEIEPPGEAVSAEASSFNVLGFNPMPIETLSELRDELNAQCGGRGVTGVVALASTVFAIIGVVEKIEVSGYCRP